jgi:hypothetical protein
VEDTQYRYRPDDTEKVSPIAERYQTDTVDLFKQKIDSLPDATTITCLFYSSSMGNINSPNRLIMKTALAWRECINAWIKDGYSLKDAIVEAYSQSGYNSGHSDEDEIPHLPNDIERYTIYAMYNN